MKTHIVQQTKYQLRKIISRHLGNENTRNGMGPLNDENKLQVDKNDNKPEKTEKTLKS